MEPDLAVGVAGGADQPVRPGGAVHGPAVPGGGATGQVPVLHAYVELDGGAVCTVMELLQPVEEERAAAFFRTLESRDPEVAELAEVIDRVLARGAAELPWCGPLDPNPANVMGRADGSLVLTDPFFADGPNLYGSLTTDAGVVARAIPADARRHMFDLPLGSTGPFDPVERARMEQALAAADADLARAVDGRDSRGPYGGRMRRPVLVLIVLVVATLGAGFTSYAASDGAAPHAVTRGVQHVPVPAAARAVDTSHPDHVIGNGTPASCTGAAVVRAVAQGGVITFRCGPDPVVIAMPQTAKVVNTSRRVVIDGGGLVTLSGEGQRRILYQDTCDQRQIWTTDHCDDQARPRLVVQHLTLAGGNSTGESFEGGGGGAIFDRGGQLKVVDTTFVGNRCDRSGPDLGGAAVRALSQYHGRPVYVVGSTFRGGRCSNGSGLSSIGVSWTVLNSVFVHNRATGVGANPPHSPHQPGGGSGAAIYTDGNDYTVRVAGTLIQHNHANEGGAAIFYVSNDRSGTLHVAWSTLQDNVNDGFQTIPGIFYLGRGPIDLQHSVIR